MPRKNSFSRSQEGGRGPAESHYAVRKKACRFCVDKQMRIDYKDGKALRPYLTERDKIVPGRLSGLCAHHQRKMTEAIKRARILGLLSFSTAQRQTV